MNQYKSIFLGTVDPQSDFAQLKRAVNTQKVSHARYIEAESEASANIDCSASVPVESTTFVYSTLLSFFFFRFRFEKLTTTRISTTSEKTATIT